MTGGKQAGSNTYWVPRFIIFNMAMVLVMSPMANSPATLPEHNFTNLCYVFDTSTILSKH